MFSIKSKDSRAESLPVVCCMSVLTR